MTNIIIIITYIYASFIIRIIYNTSVKQSIANTDTHIGVKITIYNIQYNCNIIVITKESTANIDTHIGQKDKYIVVASNRHNI